MVGKKVNKRDSPTNFSLLLHCYNVLKMRPSLSLCQNTVKLILFSRKNCSLCDVAKSVISNVRQKQPATEYLEIDVMEKGNGVWKDLYEFDTPVVCYYYSSYLTPHVCADSPSQLHGQSSDIPIHPRTTSGITKLMHLFTESQVHDLIDKIKKPASS